MPSLQRTLADLQELDASQLREVSGGWEYENEVSPDKTKTCYTDDKGVEHCVTNRDP